MFLSTQHGGPSKCLNLEILIHSLGHKPIGPHLTCVSFPVPANLEYYYIKIFFFFWFQIQPMFSSHGGSPEHPQATLEPKVSLNN